MERNCEFSTLALIRCTSELCFMPASDFIAISLHRASVFRQNCKILLHLISHRSFCISGKTIFTFFHRFCSVKLWNYFFYSHFFNGFLFATFFHFNSLRGEIAKWKTLIVRIKLLQKVEKKEVTIFMWVSRLNKKRFSISFTCAPISQHFVYRLNRHLSIFPFIVIKSTMSLPPQPKQQKERSAAARVKNFLKSSPKM